MENDKVFDFELFKKIFSEFSETDQDILEYYSKLVWSRFSCIFNLRSDWQHIWFLAVAHFLKLQKNGSVGTVNSASQGTVSVGFDTSRMGDQWWNQTQYGAEFYSLIKDRVSFMVF